MSKDRNIFGLLWKMYHELKDEEEDYENSTRMRDDRGTIISRYASMLDDRIENSGYSRSVDSLKLYTDEQLQAELDSRREGIVEED